MSGIRRKTIVRVVESVALGLIVLDVVLYFAVMVPLERLRASEEANYSAARSRVREASARVARLEAYQDAVPAGQEQLNSFLGKHVPSRRQGFSRAASLVRRFTQQSGVALNSVSYKLGTKQDVPLQRLGLEIDVEGPFPSLLRFAHALETATEFVLLRSFVFEPGEAGILTLRLGAELYLQP